jgi:hypothetical protein
VVTLVVQDAELVGLIKHVFAGTITPVPWVARGVVPVMLLKTTGTLGKVDFVSGVAVGPTAGVTIGV